MVLKMPPLLRRYADNHFDMQLCMNLSFEIFWGDRPLLLPSLKPKVKPKDILFLPSFMELGLTMNILVMLNKSGYQSGCNIVAAPLHCSEP